MILDRSAVTWVNRISTFLWSVTSVATAFAVGLGSLLGARVLLGVAEDRAFPASSKATGYWFPVRNGRSQRRSSMLRQSSPT